MVIGISISRCRKASAGTEELAKFNVLNNNHVCLSKGVSTPIAYRNYVEYLMMYIHNDVGESGVMSGQVHGE